MKKVEIVENGKQDVLPEDNMLGIILILAIFLMAFM